MNHLIFREGIKKIFANKLIAGVTAAVVVAAIATVTIVATRDKGIRSLSVFEVDGSGSVERNGNLFDIYKGMKLESGDCIEVEETSMVRLLLDEDKYVLLEPGTRIDLVATGDTKDSNTQIELKKGAVVNELHNKLGENSTYEVNTPASTMAVRGTVFRVAITKDKDGEYIVDVSVFEGNVGSKLIAQDGKHDPNEVMIPTGKAARISSTAELTEYVFDNEDIDYRTLPVHVLKYLVDLIKGKSMHELVIDVKMLEDIIAEMENQPVLQEQETPKEAETSDIEDENQVEDENGDQNGDQGQTPVGNGPAGNRPAGNRPTGNNPINQPETPETLETPETNVTIRFSANGITSSSVVLRGGKITAPAVPARTGYVFIGWYKDAEVSLPWNFETDVVNEEVTLYAGWKANRYIVTFQTNGGSQLAEIEGEYNALIVRPTNPVRVGYTFRDWYKDNNQTTIWNFLTDVIDENITLFGGWTIESFAVSFDTVGGSSVSQVQANYGSLITEPVAPQKVGHTFAGWYKEATCITPWNFASDTITQITNLYAKWTPVLYTITFQDTILSNYTWGTANVNYGSTVNKPTDPLKKDEHGWYDFAGWFTSPECIEEYNFANSISKNITLYAKWNMRMDTVQFFVQEEDGSEPWVFATTTEKIGWDQLVMKPKILPVRTNELDPYDSTLWKKIVSWYADEECTILFDFTTPMAGRKNLYAKFQ